MKELYLNDSCSRWRNSGSDEETGWVLKISPSGMAEKQKSKQVLEEEYPMAKWGVEISTHFLSTSFYNNLIPWYGALTPKVFNIVNNLITF